MTTLVIDTSIALKWFVPEEGAPDARALLKSQHDLLAPDFLLIELANALWKHTRKGILSEQLARRGLTEVPRMLNELVPSGRLISHAQTLAFEHDHPIYDCLYLALAIEADARVVSADRRLAGKLAGTALERIVIGPGEALGP